MSAFCIHSAHYLPLLKYTIFNSANGDNVMLLNSGGSVVQLDTTDFESRPHTSHRLILHCFVNIRCFLGLPVILHALFSCMGVHLVGSLMCGEREH